MRKVDPIKHQQKRDEILAAARRCLARDGFRGTTTSAICAEAGISPGHLYHYFDSKEAIIAAWAETSLAQTSARLNHLAANSEALLALVLEMARLDSLLSNQSLVLDILAESRRNPLLAAAVQQQSRGMRGLLAERIRQGQAQAEIDPGLDPDSAAMVLISLIDGSKALGLRHPDLDPAALTQTLKSLIARWMAVSTTAPTEGESQA